MRAFDVIRAWGRILAGQRPSLSIEVTRECPLRCPGCYAYGPNHLGGGTTLRELSDFKGQRLVDGVLDVVNRYRPLHLSLVGGDPLVRYRELETLVPVLIRRGIHVQIVTSAFRALPAAWARTKNLNVAVSIDGLPAENNVRRPPATYERILENIAGQHVTVHCTITGQMMKQDRYLERFLQFWSPRAEIRRIWFSIFTPQEGDDVPEMLTRQERRRVVSELLDLRQRYPKLDMRKGVIEAFNAPPSSPDQCVFAQTTQTISADLRTSIQPCQFGGQPDCASCGCFASMGCAAVANHRLFGWLPIGPIFWASRRFGQASPFRTAVPEPAVEFRILQ